MHSGCTAFAAPVQKEAPEPSVEVSTTLDVRQRADSLAPARRARAFEELGVGHSTTAVVENLGRGSHGLSGLFRSLKTCDLGVSAPNCPV